MKVLNGVNLKKHVRLEGSMIQKRKSELKFYFSHLKYEDS